ncbi:MAG: Holliday junction branch migration protein RuvA [Actinomycetota bacterium]|nr:Holliday junction branch migration protein RuvA [Actinomycetota bacterium]
MIGYIEGKVTAKDPKRLLLVVQIGGLGFEVLVPAGTLERAPDMGEDISLHTFLHVRDDLLQLFGFDSVRARDLFVKLMSISGFGPQKAIGALSVFSPEDFEEMIRNSDIERLTEIPGIGRKTAERMVLEMRDRIEEPYPRAELSGTAFRVMEEAVEAMVALGFSSSEARGALREFKGDVRGVTVEEMIQFGLKFIGSGKRH